MTIIKLPKNQQGDVTRQLTQLPLFAGVTEEQLQHLLRQAMLCELEAGAPVFHQGDPADYWYLVLQGRIDTLRCCRDGEDRVVQHLPSGTLLAPIVIFVPHRGYPVDTRAATFSRLCRFPREALVRLCLAAPEVAVKLLEHAGRALTLRIDDVENLAGRSASQRLAAYLLQLSHEQGECIELPLNQRQLAAKLGVRAETLNRLLAQWQKDGLLCGQRRHWQLAQPERLSQLASA